MVNGEAPANCTVNDTLPYDPFKLVCKTAASAAGSGRVRVQMREDSGIYAESTELFTFHVSLAIVSFAT